MALSEEKKYMRMILNNHMRRVGVPKVRANLKPYIKLNVHELVDRATDQLKAFAKAPDHKRIDEAISILEVVRYKLKQSKEKML